MYNKFVVTEKGLCLRVDLFEFGDNLFLIFIMSGSGFGNYAIAILSYPEGSEVEDDMNFILRTVSYGYDTGSEAYSYIPEIAKEGNYKIDDLVVYKLIDKDNE